MTSDLAGAAATPSWLDPVVRKLRAFGPLSRRDEVVIGENVGPRMRYPSGADLFGDQASALPLLVLSGWAAWQRVLPDGRRQIFFLALPGDRLAPARGGEREGSAVALTPLETASAGRLEAIVRSLPDSALHRAMDGAARRHEQLLMDQILRTGRLAGVQRAAHLLLELHDRLEAVGLARGGSFALPLTQETLADTLGLSSVHMSRVLKVLRDDGYVDIGGGEARLRRVSALAVLAARGA